MVSLLIGNLANHIIPASENKNGLVRVLMNERLEDSVRLDKLSTL